MAVLVMDNGAYSAKVGYSTAVSPKIIPNCITKARNVRTRIFIGDQIEDCKDLSGLFYILPSQKGYLVNWEVEHQIWDHVFGKECMKVDFDNTGLIFTEPYFNFASIQESLNEIFFEEYGFQYIYRTNPAFLSQYKHQKSLSEKHLCSLVVDSGYSFSHIVPYHNGKKIKSATKRTNVGGKILTNHLKEIISYRQLMVMDETYVINQMKEDVCYVSTQFQKDMDIARKKGADNTVTCDYVLPDYTHIKRGYAKTREESTGKAKGSEQIIRMNNERFAVPEILFHPSDVGIQEMGISEAISYVVKLAPEEMQPHLLRNIVLTGGNCMLPGFKDRVYQDVRSLTPADYEVNVTQPNNPITFSWEGGAALAQDPQFKKMVVTKAEFEEHGQEICEEKFDV
ncbi:actin-related protein 6 [Lingula anatina]|uniref:Actin-related protein 6 n=1 Tax=Lingula anatina TaxID=7574 RepID=A0A1S3IIV0_LINAN|nr:actin-related protein 6 [Lingula anatina]|eukprot:XP_013398165.1 actin-related protein 6 [Lingula anatina]